ncbi:MAG: hypothetical protein SWK76_09750 [Actinomycetota bacterium]|nr:hypothetical protein [Actinomycetota bacterium]
MSGPADELAEGFIYLDEAMSAAGERTPPPPLSPDNVVAIFYASGISGFPKGAIMASRNLLTAQKAAADSAGFSAFPRPT